MCGELLKKRPWLLNVFFSLGLFLILMIIIALIVLLRPSKTIYDLNKPFESEGQFFAAGTDCEQGQTDCFYEYSEAFTKKERSLVRKCVDLWLHEDHSGITNGIVTNWTRIFFIDYLLQNLTFESPRPYWAAAIVDSPDYDMTTPVYGKYKIYYNEVVNYIYVFNAR